MRFGGILALAASLIAIQGHSVEITIKTEQPATEPPKDDAKKNEPELPQRAQLNLIGVNTTTSTFVVTVDARAGGSLEHRKIIVQNHLPAHDAMTLGTLFDSSSDTLFEFNAAEVWMMTPIAKSMTCEVKHQAPEKPESPAVPQEPSTEPTKEPAPTEPTAELLTSAHEAPDGGATLTAKKSFVFYFYLAPGQDLPQCVIYADLL